MSGDPKSLIRIARTNGEEASAEPVDLGARVRAIRTERNWTLEQAARQAGLARSTLSKIENGQMSPTYDALKKLAVGLEISIPQRVDGRGNLFAKAGSQSFGLGEGLGADMVAWAQVP